MVIRITLVALLLSVSTLAQSQIIIALIFGDKLNSDKIKMGMNVGANYSTINSFNRDYSRTSLNLGLFFEFKLSDRIYLNPNLYFINESGGLKLPSYLLNDSILDEALSESNVRRQLKYYSLPVLLKIRMFNQFYFEVGPQVSLLSKANDYFYQSTSRGDIVLEHNIKSAISRWDFGALAGFSYKLRKGEGMSINLRYYQGFLPIYAYSGAPTQYNQIIQAGISFSIKTKNPDKPKGKEE